MGKKNESTVRQVNQYVFAILIISKLLFYS
jgi:hypothetical protein